jgi:EpsI family protein
LCASAALLYANILSPPDEGAGFEREFPEKIDAWRAGEVDYDTEVLGELSADTIIYKSYRDGRGGVPIVLFMACYETLEKADRSHSPIVCSAGQGWQIVKSTGRRIPVNSPDTREIEVNQTIHTKRDNTMMTLFWYQSADRAFRNRAMQKLSLLLSKLRGGDQKNAFVRVTSTLPPGHSVDEGKAELLEFVQRLYPELKLFFL